MTQITATIIEMSARREGVVFVAGVRVEAAGLPALTGSAKQIAWADKIRTAALDRLGTEIGEIVAKRIPRSMIREDDPVWVDVCKQVQAATARLSAKIGALTAAAWWIDNRDALARDAAPTIGRAR